MPILFGCVHRAWIALGLVALLAAGDVVAGPTGRGAAAGYPASIRQAGMGTAAGVPQEDPGEAGANPAALAGQFRNYAVAAGGGALFDGESSYGVAGASARVGGRLTLGVLVASATQDLREIDAQGDATGRSLAQSTLSAGVQGAWYFLPQLSAGLGVRLVRDEVGGDSFSVPAVDVGVSGGFDLVTAGVAVRSLAPSAKPSGAAAADGLPVDVRVQAAVRVLPSLSLGAGYSAAAGRDARLALGGEWTAPALRFLSLRAGLEGLEPDDRNPAAGLSVVAGNFLIDYAFVLHAAGASHLAGVRMAFDRLLPAGAAPAAEPEHSAIPAADLLGSTR